jgi:protein-L-isoaspartate(D-aspartate) O-methyltransferase
MNDVRERVKSAFDTVGRERFLPPGQRPYAREDRPLDIGHGQTNSQPHTVKTMLEELDARPGDRVLDVGCGSGWTTALLGALVGDDGSVVGTEIVPELVKVAQHNVADAGDHVQVRAADPAVLGAPDLAPFDRILVSAQARALPDPLVDQLAPGGRMVVPVGRDMTIVDRTRDDETTVRRIGHFAFVPLIWDPPDPTR